MTPACGTPRGPAAAADLDLGGPVELAVLAVKRSAASCRLLASNGTVTLAESFDGLPSCGCIDNRPFLRCLHGFGLCVWHLGRFEDSGFVFDRMLRLHPSDNQDVRFLIDHVRAGTTWE